MRLRFATPTATANKAQKRHSKKKNTYSEQVCRQKEFDAGQKNITQSTHASDKCVMLVFMSFHLEFPYNNYRATSIADRWVCSDVLF